MRNVALHFVSVLCFASTTFAHDEYIVSHGPEARLLSKELQSNAKSSPKRFDAEKDVSNLKAWFVGSVDTADEDFHFVAYWTPEFVTYIGVFRQDKTLHALWKFKCDARQFYVEDAKLMFSARPMYKSDRGDTFANVPRYVVVDFGELPADREFHFRDTKYSVPN